jgi:hypothetical protein
MSAPTARLNPRHQEMIREKIRASQILNVLEDHILDGKEMSRSQVAAALGLLKKCVPDLTATTLSGDPDQPLVHKVERHIVRANIKD